MPPVPPEVDPHLVPRRQQRRAADAGHLAAAVGEAGVVHRSQTLPVLEYGTLSSSTHGHVHGEVVQAVQGAGEDARVGAVGVALVDQHVHQLQDATVVGGAVSLVQPGSEGNYCPCRDEDSPLETLHWGLSVLGWLTWWDVRVDDLPLFFFSCIRLP